MRGKSVIEDNKTNWVLREMKNALTSLKILETFISNHGIGNGRTDKCIEEIQEGLEAANRHIHKWR